MYVSKLHTKKLFVLYFTKALFSFKSRFIYTLVYTNSHIELQFKKEKVVVGIILAVLITGGLFSGW